VTPVLLLTPQHEELTPLLDRLRVLGHPATHRSFDRIEGWDLASLGLIAAVGGHGKTQFGV